MKIVKEPTWQHTVTGEEGNTTLFDVNIFEYEWINTQKSTIVYHPIDNKKCRFQIYEVEVNGQKHKFAAGEFSNGVWGFYTYRY